MAEAVAVEPVAAVEPSRGASRPSRSPSSRPKSGRGVGRGRAGRRARVGRASAEASVEAEPVAELELAAASSRSPSWSWPRHRPNRLRRSPRSNRSLSSSWRNLRSRPQCVEAAADRGRGRGARRGRRGAPVEVETERDAEPQRPLPRTWSSSQPGGSRLPTWRRRRLRRRRRRPCRHSRTTGSRSRRPARWFPPPSRNGRPSRNGPHHGRRPVCRSWVGPLSRVVASRPSGQPRTASWRPPRPCPVGQSTESSPASAAGCHSPRTPGSAGAAGPPRAADPVVGAAVASSLLTRTQAAPSRSAWKLNDNQASVTNAEASDPASACDSDQPRNEERESLAEDDDRRARPRRPGSRRPASSGPSAAPADRRAGPAGRPATTSTTGASSRSATNAHGGRTGQPPSRPGRARASRSP